jgi:hypothetical protein
LENQAPESEPIDMGEPLEESEDGWYEKSLLEGRMANEVWHRKMNKDGLRYVNHHEFTRLSEYFSCVSWEAQTGSILFHHEGDPSVETLCMLAFTIKVENGPQSSLTISIDLDDSKVRYTFDLANRSKLRLDLETIETLPEDESESFFSHYRYWEDELIFSLTQSDQNLNFHKLNLQTGDSVSLHIIDGALHTASWYLESENITADWIYGSNYTSVTISFFDEEAYLSTYDFYESSNSTQIQLSYALVQLGNWDRMYFGTSSNPVKGLYASDTFIVGNVGSVHDETAVLLYVFREFHQFVLIVNHKNATLTGSLLDVTPYGLTFTHAQWNPSAIEAISDKTEDPATSLNEYADLVALSQTDEPSFSFGRVPF